MRLHLAPGDAGSQPVPGSRVQHDTESVASLDERRATALVGIATELPPADFAVPRRRPPCNSDRSASCHSSEGRSRQLRRPTRVTRRRNRGSQHGQHTSTVSFFAPRYSTVIHELFAQGSSRHRTTWGSCSQGGPVSPLSSQAEQQLVRRPSGVGSLDAANPVEGPKMLRLGSLAPEPPHLGLAGSQKGRSDV